MLKEKTLALRMESLKAVSARTAPLDLSVELLVEPIVAKPHLVVVGAGHVGLALAKLAHGLDYDVTVIDDRPEFASQERFPAGVEVVRADMVEALTALRVRSNSAVVVATRCDE